jgi:hypothetical protein
VIVAARVALDRARRLGARRGRVGPRAGRGSGLGAVADHLVENESPLGALCAAYEMLGLESIIEGDRVFRDLVLARINEPTSKGDAGRVLAEVGVDTAVVCHCQASATDLWPAVLAAGVVGGVCAPCRAGTGVAGAL